MSLKSFDKFCETMVNPDKSKNLEEIFDERQKQVQIHLVVETLVIFAALVFIHCIISDFIIKWSESNLLPMLLYAMLCVNYYIIRAGVKGCFVGVNGAFARYAPTFMCIILGFANGFRALSELSDNGYEIVKESMLTDDFIGLITYALMMTTGILSAIFIKKSNKEREK